MLSSKRLLCDEEEEELRACKRTLGDNEIVYESFGPIPLEWFDPSLFPPTALVTVYVPKDVVEQPVIPMSAPSSPVSLPPSTPFEVVDMDFVPSSPVPLPFDVVAVQKPKPRVVFGRKTDVKHILNLLDVPVYSALPLALTPRMLLESIPVSMMTKRRNMGLLLTNCASWLGVGVLTLDRETKQPLQRMFTSELTGISQYVRPLGLASGELVLPSNAICYTSYNKGNRQVTYILTDLLKYADIVSFNKLLKPKKKQSTQSDTKNVKRFSSGMTVLKNWTKPLEVQFSLLALLALAFFLFRKWCRSTPALTVLLDPLFQEPTFEELSASIIRQSASVLRIAFTEKEIHLLLKRANCLFKKLVQLFVSLYPDSNNDLQK